jgi:hypothetical protein
VLVYFQHVLQLVFIINKDNKDTTLFIPIQSIIYIWVHNLSVQDLFLSELLQAMILWPETKKLVILFLRIYLIASLLFVHCVSPQWRSHKPRRISTLKTKYHLLWLPSWPQPIIEDGSSIQGRLQDGANIEELKYLSKGKVFSIPTLSLSPLCPRMSNV